VQFGLQNVMLFRVCFLGDSSHGVDFGGEM
jgi:hypothetical protein